MTQLDGTGMKRLHREWRRRTAGRLALDETLMVELEQIKEQTRPDNILFMVGLAFSIGAASFFPALVLGIFWKRANRAGAVSGWN